MQNQAAVSDQPGISAGLKTGAKAEVKEGQAAASAAAAGQRKLKNWAEILFSGFPAWGIFFLVLLSFLLAPIKKDIARLEGGQVSLQRTTVKLEQKIDGLEQRMDQRIEALGQRLDQKIDSLGQRMDRLEGKIDQLLSLKRN